MPSRYEDWLRQAQRDISHAQNALEDGDYDWACFAAQQAAEKAVKALLRFLAADAWGHSVSLLLGRLPEPYRPSAAVIDGAKELDKHYTFIHATQVALTRVRHSITIPRMKPYGASAMPEPSSPSVKVTFTNRKQILTALENLIQEWTQKHPELEQVILFGSHARRDFFPGSDVDVLLILEKSDQPFLKRIPKFLPIQFPVDIDVFPYTRDEVQRMLKDPYSLVAQACYEGKQMYP
jgi:predicted nucleotidyltransferase